VEACAGSVTVSVGAAVDFLPSLSSSSHSLLAAEGRHWRSGAPVLCGSPLGETILQPSSSKQCESPVELIATLGGVGRHPRLHRQPGPHRRGWLSARSSHRQHSTGPRRTRVGEHVGDDSTPTRMSFLVPARVIDPYQPFIRPHSITLPP
jgi:hypothetical protein